MTLQWGGTPQLNAFEDLMWRLDHREGVRGAVTGIEILDRAPNSQRLREAHRWAMECVPRLRQKLRSRPMHLAQWIDDPNVDLDRQLQFVTLPAPGTHRQLLDHAQAFAQEAFDPDCPPWQVQLVTGLKDGKAAYIIKMHHAMADGIGVIQLLSAMHSRQRATSPDRRRAMLAATPAKTTSDNATGALRLQTLRQAGAAISALKSSEPRYWVSESARYLASLRRIMSPLRPPPSPLLSARSGIWHFESIELPLEAMKRVAKHFAVSLNDVLVSGLLGGLRRYHAHFGAVPAEIPISFPINARQEGDAAGGNHFVPGQLAGPLGEPDPLLRMRRVGEQVRRIRDEPALTAPVALMPLLAKLPSSLAADILRRQIVANDIQISNVPGLREDVYIAGARVERILPYAPLPGVAAMIGMVTHGPWCCIGFNLDGGAFVEPERLATETNCEFNALFEVR